MLKHLLPSLKRLNVDLSSASMLENSSKKLLNMIKTLPYLVDLTHLEIEAPKIIIDLIHQHSRVSNRRLVKMDQLQHLIIDMKLFEFLGDHYIDFSGGKLLSINFSDDSLDHPNGNISPAKLACYDKIRSFITAQKDLKELTLAPFTKHSSISRLSFRASCHRSNFLKCGPSSCISMFLITVRLRK